MYIHIKYYYEYFIEWFYKTKSFHVTYMYVHSFSLYKTCTCMTFPGTLAPGSNCGEIGQCCMCTFKLPIFKIQYNMNNFYEPDFPKNLIPLLSYAGLSLKHTNNKLYT